MAPTLNPAFRLRPLDLGDVLDESFRLYRARFGLLFTTALVATAPSLLSNIGSQGGFFGLMTQAIQANQGFARPPDTTLAPLSVAGGLLALVMFPLVTAMPTFAACAAALGLPETPGSILRAGLRTYWRVFGIGILVLLVGVTSILIISIPFVIMVLVRWSFRYQAVYLEGAGVGAALNRSGILVRNSWWRVFGILFVVGLLVAVVSFIFGIVAGLAGFAAPSGLGRQVITGVLTSLVQALVVPYTALATTLLYLDLRIRKESLDLQLMAGQVGQADYAPPPAPPDTTPWGELPPVSPG